MRLEDHVGVELHGLLRSAGERRRRGDSAGRPSRRSGLPVDDADVRVLRRACCGSARCSSAIHRGWAFTVMNTTLASVGRELRHDARHGDRRSPIRSCRPGRRSSARSSRPPAGLDDSATPLPWRFSAASTMKPPACSCGAARASPTRRTRTGMPAADRRWSVAERRWSWTVGRRDRRTDSSVEDRPARRWPSWCPDRPALGHRTARSVHSTSPTHWFCAVAMLNAEKPASTATTLPTGRSGDGCRSARCVRGGRSPRSHSPRRPLRIGSSTNR